MGNSSPPDVAQTRPRLWHPQGKPGQFAGKLSRLTGYPRCFPRGPRSGSLTLGQTLPLDRFGSALLRRAVRPRSRLREPSVAFEGFGQALRDEPDSGSFARVAVLREPDLASRERAVERHTLKLIIRDHEFEEQCNLEVGADFVPEMACAGRDRDREAAS